MLPKCLNCQKNISLAWFVVARMFTKYRCTECGVLHEFTQRHKLIGIIAVIPLITLVNVLESIVPSSVLRFILLLALAVIVMIFIPKQHRLSEYDNLKEEIKNND
jgi:CXXC-20-CXXC protein